MASIKAIVKSSYMLQGEIKNLMTTLNNNKVQIQKFFDEKKIKSIEAEARENLEDIIAVAKVQEKCYIDYNVDAMKEKFDKDLFNQVVNKEYYIEDIDGLIELLREAGVKPKDFKKLIRTVITPNKEALKQAFAVGDLTKDDLEGCYSANITKSIQIVKKK